MKPGPKPKGAVITSWSHELAYAVGLIVADGCLSKDGRHIDFTSTDIEQIVLFKECLGIKNKISNVSSAFIKNKAVRLKII